MIKKKLKGFTLHHFFHKKGEGFTLIELLIVVAIVAILSAVVLIAVNPAKQMRDARNAERRMEVNVLINAISQYLVDNQTLPVCIATTDACIGDTAPCCDLSGDLVPVYIADIPVDESGPIGGTTANTGYNVLKYGAGDAIRVTVSAVNAEGTTISASR